MHVYNIIHWLICHTYPVVRGQLVPESGLGGRAGHWLLSGDERGQSIIHNTSCILTSICCGRCRGDGRGVGSRWVRVRTHLLHVGWRGRGCSRCRVAHCCLLPWRLYITYYTCSQALSSNVDHCMTCVHGVPVTWYDGGAAAVRSP